MKIRSGFVSNSSSSSFIVYGFFSDDLPEEIYERIENENVSEDFWDLVERSYDSDGTIVGKRILWFENNAYIDPQVFSQENLNKKKEEIKDIFKKEFNYTPSDTMFKLIGRAYYDG